MAAISEPTGDRAARQLLRHTVSTLAYRAGKPCVMRRKRSQHSPLLKTAGSRCKSWLTWAIFLTGRFPSLRASRLGMILSRYHGHRK